MIQVADEICELFSKFQLLRLGRGETLIRAGDPPDYLYWMKSGVVRQYVVADTGDELSLYLYGPRSCFFLPWCFGLTENQYFFDAMTEVYVWRAPMKKMKKALYMQPGSLDYLLRGSQAGLYALMVHMESLVYGDAVKKVSSVLMILSRWYGRQLSNGSVLIELPLPHRILATMVGMTRETTTTAIGKLKKDGVIGSERRYLVIRDLPKLQQITAKYFDAGSFIPRPVEPVGVLAR